MRIRLASGSFLILTGTVLSIAGEDLELGAPVLFGVVPCLLIGMLCLLGSL